MNAAESQANAAPAPVISWWLSAILGVAVGVTVSLIRTERYFFIMGAGILALVILLLGLLTIRRRQRYPQLMSSKASRGYVLWSLLIIFMVGPVQVIFPADEPDELWLKSILLSLVFTVAIRGADHGLVRGRSGTKGSS
ncbi:hypothetical protein OK351_13295 [Glutamicibacter sp. MNS18]|uniref:hypothetical protein n=1 Tax=Glutamicibacter sp. MNS18 TaxID=2989817 RepID=UPI0022358ABE|nr:hypothetical protein [Glutamicibacter sp. MNS18]MCW4466472.1 hypothetical protein [Glutamicibacter sp. MNS18]